MGQEYFIKSSDLESKVRELLPSQGGLGAGFDLSASTQIVPIVDLTESAEGSNVRADLQTALSFKTATAFAVQNANTTLISNTGYYRVFGAVSSFTSNPLGAAQFILTDGARDLKPCIACGIPPIKACCEAIPVVPSIVLVSCGTSPLCDTETADCSNA